MYLVTRSRNKLCLVQFFPSFQACNSQQRSNTFPKRTRANSAKKDMRHNFVLEGVVVRASERLEHVDFNGFTVDYKQSLFSVSD